VPEVGMTDRANKCFFRYISTHTRRYWGR